MTTTALMTLIIKTQCPHCNHIQNTTTIYRVRCHGCNRSYEVYPLDSHGKVKKSRIIEIVEGTMQELHEMSYKKLRKIS